MTEAMGQPSTAMNEPLSSNAVAAMAAPITPSRITRASTYIPVPPIRRVRITWTVKSRRTGTRYPMRDGRLKAADCQLKASGAPRALYGFHNGRSPWCTWVQARVVQGMISRIRSEVWELWGAGGWACRRPKCWDRPSRFSWSKGPSDHPWASAGTITTMAATTTQAMPKASGSQRRVRLSGPLAPSAPSASDLIGWVVVTDLPTRWPPTASDAAASICPRTPAPTPGQWPYRRR